MRSGRGHRILLGRKDIVRRRITRVLVRRGVAAPAVGRWHRESLGRQDVVGRLPVQIGIPLTHGKCLGGKDVMRFLGPVAGC